MTFSLNIRYRQANSCLNGASTFINLKSGRCISAATTARRCSYHYIIPWRVQWLFWCIPGIGHSTLSGWTLVPLRFLGEVGNTMTWCWGRTALHKSVWMCWWIWQVLPHSTRSPLSPGHGNCRRLLSCTAMGSHNSNRGTDCQDLHQRECCIHGPHGSLRWSNPGRSRRSQRFCKSSNSRSLC